MLCPKLKKRIELSKRDLSYDDIIDVFAPLGYKMKVTSKGLRVSTVSFKLTRDFGKKVVTFKRPIFRNLVVIILTLFGVFLLETLIGNVHEMFDIQESQFWPFAIPIMVFIGLVTLFCLFRMFKKQSNIFKYFTNALIK